MGLLPNPSWPGQSNRQHGFFSTLVIIYDECMHCLAMACHIASSRDPWQPAFQQTIVTRSLDFFQKRLLKQSVRTKRFTWFSRLPDSNISLKGHSIAGHMVAEQYSRGHSHQDHHQPIATNQSFPSPGVMAQYQLGQMQYTTATDTVSL